MKTIVWRIHDHKPGHANQTRGLVNALTSMTEIEAYDVQAPTRWQSWRWWMESRFPIGQGLPRPDLILSAGHTTHIAALAARRACGGKAIVLMKPSLPVRLFDLAIIPEHDATADSGNIILTRGVLNVIEPSTVKQQSRGLMLVGGPAANSGWDTDAMITQIVQAAEGQPTVNWTLTTSRRTPADFVALLTAERPENLTIVPCEDTGPRWVPDELARAAQVWVSEDSVSMVYESLTSGAAVGLFAVPAKHTGRVARGMNKLRETGWVTRFSGWDRHSPLPLPPQALHEARRCAELICERYGLPRNQRRDSRLAG